MDDLEQYLRDLRRMASMKFGKLVLVHTLGYQIDNIIVDAAPKIDAYIKYRLDKEEYIFSLIKDHPSISKDDL